MSLITLTLKAVTSPPLLCSWRRKTGYVLCFLLPLQPIDLASRSTCAVLLNSDFLTRKCPTPLSHSNSLSLRASMSAHVTLSKGGHDETLDSSSQTYSDLQFLLGLVLPSRSEKASFSASQKRNNDQSKGVHLECSASDRWPWKYTHLTTPIKKEAKNGAPCLRI